ncbi:MAG: biopolymer transporter ExbD [candidate division Zixibacteria bacterium]|nr:biopolymer transporter ExbD [candidate division Zixibacteria bacterium]
MRRKRENRLYPKMHDINVTNLVDVVLVLLIVFMITAPLMQSGIDVNLPETRMADATLSDGVVVTIDERGVTYIDDRVVELDRFQAAVRRAYDENDIKQVFLRADESVTHGVVVDVMGRIKNAGIIEVGLVTKLPAQEETTNE